MIIRILGKNGRAATNSELPVKNDLEINLRLLTTPVLRKYKTDASLIDIMLKA